MHFTAKIKRHELTFPVTIERGALLRLGELVPNCGRVLILTGSGVPEYHVKTAASLFEHAECLIVQDGERAKSMETYTFVMQRLLDRQLDKGDVLLALGGGTVGDLGGFAASTYKRGIGLVHVPTTTLSQLDACIGGKTALNLSGIKNVIGTVYQPCAVVIDPDLLNSLSRRHYYNGLAEALKAGIIRDAGLFEMLENKDFDMEEVISRAILVKLSIVQEDESDASQRQLLNFGHTIGHALESALHGNLLHGECVLWGMLPMLEDAADRERLLQVIKAWGILSPGPVEPDLLFEKVLSDKKVRGDRITVTTVKKFGEADLKSVSVTTMRQYIDEAAVYWREK